MGLIINIRHRYFIYIYIYVCVCVYNIDTYLSHIEMFFQMDFVQNFVTPNKEFCCFGTRQAFALGFNIPFFFFLFSFFFF